MDEYYRRTGVKWNNIWPRPPVAYHMYGTDTIGDVDPVVVPYAHWHSTSDDLSKLGKDVCGSCSRAASDLGAAQENVTIQVETVSTSPRVVRISNFMSSDECDEFIKTAKDNGGFQRSVTTDAGVVHPSRTSSNIWLFVDTGLDGADASPSERVQGHGCHAALRARLQAHVRHHEDPVLGGPRQEDLGACVRVCTAIDARPDPPSARSRFNCCITVRPSSTWLGQGAGGIRNRWLDVRHGNSRIRIGSTSTRRTTPTTCPF